MTENIRNYYADMEADIKVESCTDRDGILARLKSGKYDVVVIALPGTEGMETAICARHLTEKGLIWISDLDFAIQSYRMRVTYFIIKPVSLNLLYQALERCRELQ